MVAVDKRADQLGQKADQLGQKADQLGQKADQLGQKADQLAQRAERIEEINILLETTSTLITRLNVSLPKLIETPKDIQLVESIRSDMIQLRVVKTQWLELSNKTANIEYKK